MTFQFPAALTIAGSDPSGGAGIQMDLKTFAKTGVWGMAVITALTAQNAAQVTGSWPMDPEMVREQIIAVLEDLTPGAIKTGMLSNTGIIKAYELSEGYFDDFIRGRHIVELEHGHTLTESDAATKENTAFGMSRTQ